MMRIRSWIAGMVLTGLVVSVASGADLEKKLINFGWDMHEPAELVRALERICYYKDADAAVVEANVEAMSKIKWGKFTDNFMYMNLGTEAGRRATWFNEAAWGDDGYFLKRVRAVARIGHAGGCKGILFDPEYGGDWSYKNQKDNKEKSLVEYRAMLRKRGAQFIKAIEAEIPTPVFLTLFWSFNKVTELADIAHAQDPQLINDIIGGARYGLVHDFMLGIVEGADKSTMFIDGNEVSYYADDFEDYNAAYHYIRQTMLGAIPEELRYKYRAQVHVGHAIFADFHHNTRGLAVPSTYMTPKERAITIEWVVYHSLKNSDKYVWFYTEKPQYLRNVRVPPEQAAAGQSVGGVPQSDLRPDRDVKGRDRSRRLHTEDRRQAG